jgi:Ca2+/H+ antiporter, TMEM165/GDT1 family
MTSDWVLFGAVFVASLVEAVEALTIVLASGFTRGWRSTLEGMGAALLALTVLVAVFGPALVRLVPLDVLRTAVGTLLLIFGLQWLRKAILRATGYRAIHDEDAIYREEVEMLSLASKSTTGRDATAFTVSFKGVFLEGLEVVVIVLTVGAPSGRLDLAALAAAAAVLVVAVAGLIVHRRLANVPENAMKMVVGIILTSFGTFWLAEGAGLGWPGSDLAILGLAAFYGAVTFVAVVGLRQRGTLPETREAA